MGYYDPINHHRRSIRLKGYDYSQPGAYFVTICTQGRERLFGEIADGEMIMNAAGKMVGKWYMELKQKFPNTQCHEYIVMPNHMHFIIEIVPTAGADIIRGEHAGSPQREYSPVRADLRVCPSPDDDIPSKTPTIPRIIQWFKTMTTNEYIRNVKQNGWPAFHAKLWQRNYYEHIIRDNLEYQKITTYIRNNPKNWHDDAFYDSQRQ